MLAVETKVEAYLIYLASSWVWELLVEPGQNDGVVVDAVTHMHQGVC